MPPGPGETLLTTLYADIHYFFRAPSTSQPQHHRFDKGSYVYLYHSPSSRRSKLEIANNAGTPDQDAFFGYFEAVHRLSYTHKHPTLVTITIDQPQVYNQAEWHLPTWDERSEKKWAHKLHSLDIYFWTEKDAATFTGCLKASVSPEKLDIRESASARRAIHSEHRDSMSPVVQQLEKTAVSTQYPHRADSSLSAHSLPGPPATSAGAAVSPPPPPPPPPAAAQQSAPMAYNPAAPAAPEPIAHREKTPPPPDDGTGTGLNNAARYDGVQQQPYGGASQQYARYPQQENSSSLQNTPQSSYFPGPPQAASNASPAPAGNIPPPPPPQQAKGPSPASFQGPPSFGPQASDTTTQYASYRSTSFGPSVASPGIASPGIYGQQPPTPSAPPAYATHAPLASPGLPPPPPGQPTSSSPAYAQQSQPAGFSSYSYSSTQQPSAGHYNPSGAFTGDVHNQLYRPTEGESNRGKARPQPVVAREDSFDSKHRVSERMSKVEKGVGAFLKKLDKNF